MNMKSILESIENMDISDFDAALMSASSKEERDLLVNLVDYKMYVRQSKIIQEEKFTI